MQVTRAPNSHGDISTQAHHCPVAISRNPHLTTNLTVKELYEELREPLALSWLAGMEGGDRSVEKESAQEHRPNLLGLLNLISPNRIQVIGRTEIEGLIRLGASIRQELFLQHCQLVIVADGVEPDEELVSPVSYTHLTLPTILLV